MKAGLTERAKGKAYMWSRKEAALDGGMGEVRDARVGAALSGGACGVCARRGRGSAR